jgi:hypothetical protein
VKHRESDLALACSLDEANIAERLERRDIKPARTSIRVTAASEELSVSKIFI